MKKYQYQNELIDKKKLRQLLEWAFKNYDLVQASAFADELKSLGFEYAGKSGISISIEDLRIPFEKRFIMHSANKTIDNLEKDCKSGKMTEVEKFHHTIEIWSYTSDCLKEQVINFFKNYDPLNSVYIMAFSGARGNITQVKQLVGMRGLMTNPRGEILNVPIKQNFHEGLTVTDYLISGFGARKGIIDTALKTANAGYLTRRLIDVAQDIIIREKDCFTNFSFRVSPIKNPKLTNKIVGRILNKPIYDKTNNQILAPANTQITPQLLEIVYRKKVDEIFFRSPLTCRLFRSICQQCYGWDLSTENLVDIGTAIGILAGQSIGEPGTQLTMRTFHTGGIGSLTFVNKQKTFRSSLSGFVQISPSFSGIPVRTRYGNNAFFINKPDKILLLTGTNLKKIIELPVFPQTLIYLQHNQYLEKNQIIGEYLEEKKEKKQELKPILTDYSGEVFIPTANVTHELKTYNNLMWFLSGQVYKAPTDCFLNLQPDYKLLPNSCIFRSKIINDFSGYITNLNIYSEYNNKKINFISKISCFFGKGFYKLTYPLRKFTHLLKIKTKNYLIPISNINSKFLLRVEKSKKFATLITNAYRLEISGIIFHNYLSKSSKLYKNYPKRIDFKKPIISKLFSFCPHLLNYWFFKYFESIRHFLILQKTFRPKNLLELIKFQDIFSDKNIFDYFVGIHTIPITIRTAIILPHKSLNEQFRHDDVEIALYFNRVLFATGRKRRSGYVHQERTIDNRRYTHFKPGVLYETDISEVYQLHQKVFFPGEIISSKFLLREPSYCDMLGLDRVSQHYDFNLLIRPFEIYEFYCTKMTPVNIKKFQFSRQKFEFEEIASRKFFSRSPACLPRGSAPRSVNLMAIDLQFNQASPIQSNDILEVCKTNNSVTTFKIHKTLEIGKNLNPKLKNKNLLTCLLVQDQQFIDQYMTLGYFESLSTKSFDIIKFKVATEDIKHIIVITTSDCLKVTYNSLTQFNMNSIFTDSKFFERRGRILLKNNNILLIQKGRPYFFPNYKYPSQYKQDPVEYITPFSFNETGRIRKKSFNINLMYDDLALTSSLMKGGFVPRHPELQNRQNKQDKAQKKIVNNENLHFYFPNSEGKLIPPNNNRIYKKSKFLPNRKRVGSGSHIHIRLRKLFIKNQGHLYSCLLPRFYKWFKINSKERKNGKNKNQLYLSSVYEANKLLQKIKNEHFPPHAVKMPSEDVNIFPDINRIYRTLLVENIDLKVGKKKDRGEFMMIKFLEFPYQQASRAVGIRRISENFDKSEINPIYYKGNQFIEKHEALGILKIEKEFSEDIVTGLPKIVGYLEARRQKEQYKDDPIIRRKHVVVRKPTLDHSFKFYPLGAAAPLNDTLNPHSLLRAYFTYYGKGRLVYCEQKKITLNLKFGTIYDNCYRSFKYIQLFILNSVQAIYRKQGVNIHNKHLELIIQQMTTKAVVCHSGDGPVLNSEIAEVYHMKQINETLQNQNGSPSYYFPYLMGITKSALSNPSFLSTASFQETVRMLTNAAIEGRIDWLRGLKENVITGRFIPSGTGQCAYDNCFKKPDFFEGIDLSLLKI
uniref:DNA-directed RNA polymerase n=1 Tax=Astrosyne radiata TaxID=1158023 RepID=A0A2U9NT48_9STRA|nr:RNA polymerase beta' subunit [Astrosyne radiata]AWT40313.1 RNA polymerase beta' subunit [Astrosyne radiata]